MAMQAHEGSGHGEENGIRLAACGIMLLTAALALFWSHVKLFWVDELLEFYSDTRPSFDAVLQGQLHYPFSLEPPAFHLLLHALNRLVPKHGELASRLPSVVAILITEACVFRFTRRLLSNRRAALFAMALPFLFATFDFAAEARVYSMLTALLAVSFVAYQTAAENDHRHRRWALLALFGGCAAAVLVHYYGIFLPLPFLAAEAVRTVQRRRIDVSILLCLFAALCTFALNLPFLRGLAEIRAHYYGGPDAEAGWSLIPATYLWLVSQYTVGEASTYGHVLRFSAFAVVYLVLPLVLVLLTARQAERVSRVSPPLFVALLAGALLPVLNVVVGHYRTHAYVLRYSVPAVVPLSVLFAWGVAPYLRSRLLFAIAILGVTGWATTQAVHDITHDWGIRSMSLAAEASTVDLVRAQASTADEHVYVQDVAKFLTTYTYASPEMRSVLVGVESLDRELFWLHRNPPAIFLRNMHCSTVLPTMALETLRQQPGAHLLVVFDDPKEEWIEMELNDRSRTATVELMGHAFGGKLLRVNFVPVPHENAATWTCKEGVVR